MINGEQINASAIPRSHRSPVLHEIIVPTVFCSEIVGGVNKVLSLKEELRFRVF